jgi:hypothetical protein
VADLQSNGNRIPIPQDLAGSQSWQGPEGQPDPDRHAVHAESVGVHQLGDEAGVMMTQGWIHVANLVANQDDRSQLAEITARLIALVGDGEFYAQWFGPALERLAKTVTHSG